MRKHARFWERMAGKKVRCTLCPRECEIAQGKVGFCRGRMNERGELYTRVYGSVVSMAVDPIEKKPLYHFWPGSDVFSMSTAGCNFRCLHCQNWSISQASINDVGFEEILPEKAIELTKRYDCKGIAYTYAEPAIWFEYCYDTAKLAHREGLYNVYVTNGYMNLEAWDEIRPYLDAMNVDVKAFSDEFYRKVVGVPSIQPVLETCEWAVEHGVHLEITNLVIPRENDNPEEIRKLCRWAVEKLGPQVPIHFSRFYPHYKMMDKPQTPVETLERAMDVAEEEGLQYIYIGNVPGHEADNTYCPGCGELLIERYGFSVTRYELKDKRCPKCKTEINLAGEYRPGRHGWF